jgi:hypothetical protein
MRHDDAPNEPRAGPPACLLGVHQIAILIQKSSIECTRKVVPEVMAGARLHDIQASRLVQCQSDNQPWQETVSLHNQKTH